MNWLLFSLGVLLVVFTLVDALWTSLWVDGGAGPFARRMSQGLWSVTQKVVKDYNHRTLSLAGPGIHTITVVAWVLMLWGGWVMVFASDYDSLKYSRPHGSTDLSGIIYFVAYTLSSMGNGDYYPATDGWEVAASFTTVSGIFMFTLVVSFLMSVVQGVTQKRSLAGQIAGLGKTSEEIVLNAWEDGTLRGLNPQIMSILQQIGQLTTQQLAYPILHRYHGAIPERDSAPTIAIFDEALTLIRFGIKEEYRPPKALLKSARSSVDSYLETLKMAAIQPSADVPSPPDLEKLKQAGLPVVSEEEFKKALEGEEKRRKLLKGQVTANGFRWPGSGKSPFQQN
ncbi:potassium channel family protein [Nafulsella turpanensis]|uniref:potassium channel family protein n=1 Tax=Nafulsella turpanensis TaxID=1265690 RepID=UPI0003470FA2|nr:potassium channel family protein [Nafulsella turpanensis]